MILKKDNIRLGLVLGLIGPILGLVVVYFLKYSAVSFREFLELFISEKRLITSLGSLSLLANITLFTLYINTRRDNTAKGIFFITVVYGIAILLLKLLK